MRSQDEQIIWDELHQFPDQVVPRERNQVILEGIRKESSRLKKMEKRRVYWGWITKGLVTCAAIFALIWFMPFSFPVETETASKIAPEDQKYIMAAEQEIKALGMNKVFRFVEVEKEEDYVIVRTKDREGIVTFKPGTTEMRSVSANYTVDELSSDYQTFVKTAQNAFEEAKSTDGLQNAHYFKNREGTSLNFTVKEPHLEQNQYKQYVTVDLKTNQVEDYQLNYNIADVEKKYIDLAEKAVKSYSNENSVTFTKARKTMQRERSVLRLMNEPANYFVEIEADTGQILQVQDTTDKYIIPSLEKVIPVTRPLIQDVFGIDLTGYQAYGGEDWGGYVLKAEGKPRIVILLADLKVGNLHAIYLD